MYEAALLLFAIAIIASCFLGWDAYKHRFLPIARPLMYFNVVLTLTCIISFVEVLDTIRPQWLSQVFQDIRMHVLRPLCVPLWAWTLLEYHRDEKAPATHKVLLFCFLIPTVTITLFLFHTITQGLVDPTSVTALITPKERLGGGYVLHVVRTVGIIATLCAILLTPYLVKNRQQSKYPRLEAMLVICLTLIPFTLYALHLRGFVNIALGAPLMIFMLLWGSRQYRLLDALPVALEGITDKVDSGILVSNMQAKLLYVNDYAKKLFQLEATPSALQQRAFPIPVTFTKHLDFSNPEKQTVLLQAKNDEGDIRYIDATLQPIFHPKLNNHLGSMVSLHDITERKQAELELQNFNRQKSEFFAGISHEFRTPLTLSMGGIDDVLEDVDPITPGQRNILTQAKANNRRLLSLVNQLLELSQLDKGSLGIKPEKLRLVSYVPMLIANFESQAEKQNIRLHFIVSSEAQQKSSVYFDPDALDKILINLISNALKSINNDAGGDVYIHLNHLEKEQLQLTVRDTGCGIPDDALPKIFDMFYSHHMNNPVWPPGTGVGLSLVKQLLLLHGGDISVSSIKGQGTCFTINLLSGYSHFAENTPIDHENKWDQDQNNTKVLIEESATNLNISELDSTVDDEDRHKQIDSVSGKHILLAEDNPDMRRYIRKHLPDFYLTETVDGAAALAQAQNAPPDLVLSDVMMPRMNGYDLCRELKSDERTSHIPVILLTAKSAQAEKLEGLSLGADDYLSKPFDVRELNLRIHNLIKSREAIQNFYQLNGLAKVITHPELPKKETVFLEKLQNYVYENIENADIKIADLAATVYMSERSLSRKVKALTGDTPKKMLLIIRLERAAKLLKETTDNITSLSYQVGFSDASHFARTFKAHYNMTATEYREQL